MTEQRGDDPRRPGPADLPPFSRRWEPGEATRIGAGELGGKARGLMTLRDLLAESLDHDALAGLAVRVPTFTVLATDVFDAFLDRNRLRDLALSDADAEEIAHAFQRGTLPTEVLGDLRALAEIVRRPLAVRSSSRLEDALFRPFAGVYETKMTPNNQPDANTRFQKLVESIKFVYASTFSPTARDYLRTVDEDPASEKMAVILQEVVGTLHGERFYPDASGVARSYNFYPTGGATRENGIVTLALGLGKTIVDDGVGWPYCPARPKNPPPYGSVDELLDVSQRGFWAIGMGRPPAHDPLSETEYLVRATLEDADYDDTLRHVASTLDTGSGRFRPGTGRPGPRMVDFAPLLTRETVALNRAVGAVMAAARAALDADVELEFALTFPGPGETGDPHLGFVQVRPMVTPAGDVTVDEHDLASPDLLLASRRVMGNGVVEGIRDLIYTRPEAFDLAKTPIVARELATWNRELGAEGRIYALIGFGRWGSSDPWLGIPVKWGQVSGARIVVEATLPSRVIEASQGSHFFHNLSSFGVGYFHVAEGDSPGIRWDRLDAIDAVAETDSLRHLRFPAPLDIRVDGRSGLGVIGRPVPVEPEP